MAEPPPIPQPALPPPPPPHLSLGARLLNVFAMPGAVFADAKASRRSVGNWLVPLVLAAVLGVLSALALASQPAARESVRRQQEKVLEKQLQSGKLSRAESDWLRNLFKTLTSRTALMVIGCIAALLGAGVRVFWWAFVLWVLGKVFLRARFSYAKSLELSGLAAMIGVLGMFVLLLLTVKFQTGSAAPGFAVVVTDLEAIRQNPLVLGTASLFSFWSIAVLSTALSRLADAPFLRAAWLVFACWVLQESVCGLFGMAPLGF